MMGRTAPLCRRCSQSFDALLALLGPVPETLEVHRHNRLVAHDPGIVSRRK